MHRLSYFLRNANLVEWNFHSHFVLILSSSLPRYSIQLQLALIILEQDRVFFVVSLYGRQNMLRKLSLNFEVEKLEPPWNYTSLHCAWTSSSYLKLGWILRTFRQLLFQVSFNWSISCCSITTWQLFNIYRT